MIAIVTKVRDAGCISSCTSAMPRADFRSRGYSIRTATPATRGRVTVAAVQDHRLPALEEVAGPRVAVDITEAAAVAVAAGITAAELVVVAPAVEAGDTPAVDIAAIARKPSAS